MAGIAALPVAFVCPFSRERVDPLGQLTDAVAAAQAGDEAALQELPELAERALDPGVAMKALHASREGFICELDGVDISDQVVDVRITLETEEPEYGIIGKHQFIARSYNARRSIDMTVLCDAALPEPLSDIDTFPLSGRVFTLKVGQYEMPVMVAGIVTTVDRGRGFAHDIRFYSTGDPAERFKFAVADEVGR
jgi:hypothetical protein